jgi:inosine/xanthosine triphosphate pyrophosphatase family protein
VETKVSVMTRFYPKNHEISFADMPAEKNAISHRKNALDKFLHF